MLAESHLRPASTINKTADLEGRDDVDEMRGRAETTGTFEPILIE